MEKIKKILICLFIWLAFTGCEKNENNTLSELNVSDMREIAELATVECYFHNVAKSEQILGKAWYEFWKDDHIKFWIEYDGVVKIGINADKLKIKVNDTKVKITLPETEVLSVTVNSESLDRNTSFYYDNTGGKPSVEDETKVFESAQENMKVAAVANSTLMINAKENAKELLENYVKAVGDALGVIYTIDWVEK